MLHIISFGLKIFKYAAYLFLLLYFFQIIIISVSVVFTTTEISLIAFYVVLFFILKICFLITSCYFKFKIKEKSFFPSVIITSLIDIVIMLISFLFFCEMNLVRLENMIKNFSKESNVLKTNPVELTEVQKDFLGAMNMYSVIVFIALIILFLRIKKSNNK